VRKAPLAIVLLGALSGCASSNTGTVTGGIEPCSGLGGGPRYAAGTVTVLQGTVGWRTVDGSTVDVFPTTDVTQQTVGTNSTYSFSLQPGQYVLQARFSTPSDIVPWVQVTVRSGETVHADIVNSCK
jgi:hypothetical protein